MRPFGSKRPEVERDIPFIFALDFVFLHKRNRPFCVTPEWLVPVLQVAPLAAERLVPVLQVVPLTAERLVPVLHVAPLAAERL